MKIFEKLERILKGINAVLFPIQRPETHEEEEEKRNEEEEWEEQEREEQDEDEDMGIAPHY